MVTTSQQQSPGAIPEILTRLCLLCSLILYTFAELVSNIIAAIANINTSQGQRATIRAVERKEDLDAREEFEVKEAKKRSLLSYTEDRVFREKLRNSTTENQHRQELRNRFQTGSGAYISEPKLQNPPYNPNYDHGNEASSLPLLDDGNTRALQYSWQLMGNTQLEEQSAQAPAENQPSASNSSLFLVD